MLFARSLALITLALLFGAPSCSSSSAAASSAFARARRQLLGSTRAGTSGGPIVAVAATTKTNNRTATGDDTGGRRAFVKLDTYLSDSEYTNELGASIRAAARLLEYEHQIEDRPLVELARLFASLAGLNATDICRDQANNAKLDRLHDAAAAAAMGRGGRAPKRGASSSSSSGSSKLAKLVDELLLWRASECLPRWAREFAQLKSTELSARQAELVANCTEGALVVGGSSKRQPGSRPAGVGAALERQLAGRKLDKALSSRLVRLVRATLQQGGAQVHQLVGSCQRLAGRQLMDWTPATLATVHLNRLQLDRSQLDNMAGSVLEYIFCRRLLASSALSKKLER